MLFFKSKIHSELYNTTEIIQKDIHSSLFKIIQTLNMSEDDIKKFAYEMVDLSIINRDNIGFKYWKQIS